MTGTKNRSKKRHNKPESLIQRETMLAASDRGWSLWRNNVANAWQGLRIISSGSDVVLRNARRIHSGLCVGSSDLIGFVPVTITPEMVGRKLAVFAAVECKSAVGRTTKEQTKFLDHVRKNGGVALVARSAGDLAEAEC